MELLGGDPPTDRIEVLNLLESCLANLGLHGDKTSTHVGVKRGLDYYVEDGFEVEYPGLGAQKQIAGGGRYEGGIGFAFGVDRVMMCE